jgi:pimeloyl-ACP methyl ester carboxylesterase
MKLSEHSFPASVHKQDDAANVISRAWKNSQAQRQKNDFFLIKTGGQHFEASRATLVAQARLPLVSKAAQNPNTRQIEFQNVDPECASNFVDYLQSGSTPASTTNLHKLAHAGKAHNLLALRQECQQLNRQLAPANPRELSIRFVRELAGRWVVRPVVALGRFLSRNGLKVFGFTSAWHPTSVGPMHSLDATGKGPLPTVVVLHGVTSCSNDYGPLLTRLRKKCKRVIALDLPGHGLSKIPENQLNGETLLQGAMEALESILNKVDGPVVLYANSMGGMAAVHCASAHPDKVHGLFLSSPGGAPVKDKDLPSFLSTFRAGSPAEGRTLFDRLFANKPPFRALVGMGIQSYLASPHIQTLLDNVQSKDFLTSEMVSSLPQKNIAFSWGTKDQMLRYQDKEWWKKTLPAQATVSEPEEFGHFPIWDNPDLLTEHVCDLAARVDKSEDSAPR